ncbi:MAG TPA: EAL domain-containing protein [Herbaspirillum sp.]
MMSSANQTNGIGRAFAVSHLVVAATALCLLGVFLLTYQFLVARQALKQDVEIIAMVISKNSSRSLALDNVRQATETLYSFQSAPYLNSAVIFQTDKEVFAFYANPNAPMWSFPDDTLLRDTYRYGLRSIEVTQPIYVNDEIRGYVVLVASTSKLYSNILIYALAYLAASIVAIGLSFPIVGKLRKEVARAEQRLDYLAFTDPVTDLSNRRAFTAKLEQIAMNSEKSTGLGILLLDVDNFKSVNDTLGHAVGDQLLKAMASRLRGAMRAGDSVYRIGGDEFGIILQPSHESAESSRTAERILSAVAAPFNLAGNQVFSTVSIGGSFYPGDTTDISALVSNADMAMYAAKKSGKNAFHAFQTEMDQLNKHRLALERDIRRGVQQSEFVVFYQPQFCAAGNAVIGVEALLRWILPDGRMISPADFIPVAESTGLINELGKWVLTQACQHARQWKLAGLGDLQVAVNVSVRQLRDPLFLDDVIRILEETELPARQLELELTESLLMEDVEGAIDFMKAVQAMGVRISIDDFGTGYSSLAYLQRFPLNRLKIDKSFIQQLPASGDAIVNAIIGLAHSFDLDVVAEGVETAAQARWLRAAGCDVLQGFWLGKPMDEPATRNLLSELKSRPFDRLRDIAIPQQLQQPQQSDQRQYKSFV